MDQSFDLGALLRKHQKKHKSKPTQFGSVAGGVKLRMEKSLQRRKSSRLSAFDCARNLPQLSPVPQAKNKAEIRLQQLQKWKEEKEKKKKESAAKKIKPFITGVPHNSLKYEPPPPIGTVPSSSGRVTRSQSAKNHNQGTYKSQSQSFAPNNAGFCAPQIKTLTNMPKLDHIKNRKDAPKLNFRPVVPTPMASVTTRSKTYQRIVAESRAKAGKTIQTKPKNQIIKPVLPPKSKVLQSSSSSENESPSYTSSSSDVELTTKMISSSEHSNFHTSTESDSSTSLQSSSSSKQPEKHSSVKRRSLRTDLTPQKLTQSSILDKSKNNTPKNPIPKSESNSEEKLRSPKSPVEAPMTPEQIAEEFKKISPCVTMSRGKSNARKEMKKKIDEGLLDEDASDMESVEHFQRQLASEIKRMTEICEVWDKIYDQVSLTESIQGMVLGAVGQARLLMTQKMQQFSQLVQRCARPETGATLVTPADLRGFWDMVFIQVENLDMRFKELEELKERNWVEKVAPVPTAAASKPRAPRPVQAKPRAGTSRLRDVIAAARKAKAQEAAQASEAVSPVERTFEAGFFCVRSPVRSPRTPATPRRQSLLKAVLSSEAEKASASKKSASFAMLRASVLGKSVECEGVAPLPQSPLPQINLHATPGRSILKQPQDNNKSTHKQCKVVLFDQSDEMNSSMEYLNLPKDKETVKLTKQVDSNAHSDVPMDMDEREAKQTEIQSSGKTKRFTRQNALCLEIEAFQTEQAIPQSEQTNPHSEKKTTKRSARKKVQAEISDIQTPQQEKTQKTSRRSIRNKVSADVEAVSTPRTEEMLQEQNTPLSEKKTPHAEKKTPKRSARKKIEVAHIQMEQDIQKPEQKTSRRSIRNKVLAEIESVSTPQTELVQPEQKTPHSENKTPKRSTRKKVVKELEKTSEKENYTPMRSTRRKKTEIAE